MSTTIYLVIATALTTAVVLAVRRSLAATSPLPPGPERHWLTGTNLGPGYSWRILHALSKQYGPVMTIWSGRKPTVVVSTIAAADSLLEKSASNTADRPSNYVASDLFSHGRRTLLVGHGNHWRKLRRALASVISPAQSRSLRPTQERLARLVLSDIAAEPDRFQDHIQTYAASLTVRMAYGRTGRARYSDKDVRAQVAGGERLGTLLRPGSMAVQRFPWLRYVPGYLGTVQQWADEELALYRGGLEDVRQRMKRAGGVSPCFATHLLDHQKELELDDDDIAYLLGSVFGAGSDTSSSAITICVMAAASHPEEAAAVAAELDEVCGGTAPTFADIEELPRLRAYVAETFRWRPVSSGGFAHATLSDMTYGGHHIPKGTAIVGNHWAISRDTAYYGEDVEAFRPGRWLTEDGEFRSDLKHVQFGFGRRVCPGQHVASASVMINCANLLWAYNVRPKSGGKFDNLAFTHTANSHPLPFDLEFRPRHDVAVDEHEEEEE